MKEEAKYKRALCLFLITQRGRDSAQIRVFFEATHRRKVGDQVDETGNLSSLEPFLDSSQPRLITAQFNSRRIDIIESIMILQESPSSAASLSTMA